MVFVILAQSLQNLLLKGQCHKIFDPRFFSSKIRIREDIWFFKNACGVIDISCTMHVVSLIPHAWCIRCHWYRMHGACGIIDTACTFACGIIDMMTPHHCMRYHWYHDTACTKGNVKVRKIGIPGVKVTASLALTRFLQHNE
jgi:hypothetical protein